MRTTSPNDEGSSFIESLITIVVAGMACVAFISVTAAIVRETVNQRVKESMVQYALNGLEKVRSINATNPDLGIDLTSTKYTFKINGDKLELIANPGEEVDCTGQAFECEELDLDQGDGFFYRKVEIMKDIETSGKVLRVRVEVGRMKPVSDTKLNSDHVEGFIAVK